MNKKLLIKTLLLFFLFGGALNKLYAEGTSTASPTLTNLSSLSILPSQNRGAFLGCPQDNRIYIHINSLNERIYYGFNWRGYASGNNINPTINNVFMRIFNPNGVQVAQVNLPTSGNGFISSYNAAKIGANISGSNPGGYSPLSYTPTMTGEYWIELYQSNDGGNTQMGGTTWSFSPYWDIQVAETNGTRYNGRVHCANWSFNATSSTYFTTNYDDDAAPEIYAWSTDSNVFKINFTEGFRPIAYNVAVTNYGVQNTNNFVVDRKSKNSETYPTLSNGYLLFLNPPDSSIYPNGVLPTNPKLESPILVGCTYPFKIRYTVYGTGDVRLLLDLNGVDGFQPGTKDLVLEQFNVQPGLNTVIWDGKDGLGNNVPSGTSFKLILSYGKGRINVPIYDAEINKNGFIITSISPKYDAAIKLYWDDTNLPNVGAACSVSGDNQNNLTGNGWDNSFVGAISPCHAWNGNGNPNQTIPAPAVSGNDADNLQCNDFGNVRVINTFGWATSAYDSAIVFFGCLQVSGTIWNDKDNSANGGFSNIYTLGEYGTNIQNTLYVSMVDPVTGLVLESVPVNPDGTYTFNAVPPKAEGLQIVLSNTQGIVDSLPPTAIINPKWQNTSPLIRTFNTDTLSITGLDFGVRTQEVEPDINQTIVNIPVNGTVATNDHVIPGSVFTPIGTMANGGTLVMNPDGSYIYTPPADFIGRDSISYVACSPVPTICDTTTLTIIVTPLNSQYTNTVIAQDDYATTPKNTPVTMCLLCNDSDPQGNTISNPTIIANPSHGTVTVNPNGTVVYTPAPGYVGKDVYQYTICDNGVPVACDTAYAYVTITDNPISNNQTYANDDAYVTKINTPVTDNVGLNDTDPQGDNVTFTKVTNPNHGTVILNPDGTFTYTPNNGYTGPDQFIYSKCDDGTPTACDTATVYITIDRPIQSVEPDINQTIVNIPVNGTVATNDHVIPGSIFTPIGTMANGGTLVMNPDGSYIYTPPADFIGRDSISYVACSPAPVNLCDTTTLTIIVTPLYTHNMNTIIAQDDYATTPKNTPVTMCLLCNDSDPQGNTISNPTIIANPSHGTVTVNPNGTVVYTPASGYVGKDVYQYTICDNGVPVACDTAYAYVTITDNPISNNQTYANDDAYVTPINTPVTDNVGLNDTDPQGDNVTFTKVTNPNHGTVILNLDGTFTYTPNNGYTGPDQFIYSKCDDGDPVACDTATVYITITNPNVPLPAFLSSFNVVAKDCKAELLWTTEQEFSVSHFDIQRQYANEQFVTIFTKPAVGFSSTKQNYSFIDKNVKEGNVAYRLNIYDIDGKNAFSNVKQANIQCSKITDLQLYPNPSNDVTTLSITNTEDLSYVIKMYDAVGKIVYNTEIDVNKETKLINIPVSHLSTGLYTIKVIDSDNESKVIRFLKSKN